MRQWNGKIDLGKNLFFINGEKIPIFYSRKVPIVSPKNIHWINIKYPKGTFPLNCWLQNHHISEPPSFVNFLEGIPIRAPQAVSIGPNCQRIVETGLSFEFPKGIFAEVSSVSEPSRIEPLIAPGLITNGLTNIHLLCANLNKTVIKIQKNQIIGHLNLNGIESVFEIYSFGNLTKFIFLQTLTW